MIYIQESLFIDWTVRALENRPDDFEQASYPITAYKRQSAQIDRAGKTRLHDGRHGLVVVVQNAPWIW